jgi:VanZ family protein
MKIAKDKWKHFFVGIAMGAVLQSFFFYFMRFRLSISILLAFIFSAVIGYGFELFSKFTGKGHYEVMDAVAAVIGAVLGMSLIILLQSV